MLLLFGEIRENCMLAALWYVLWMCVVKWKLLFSKLVSQFVHKARLK